MFSMLVTKHSLYKLKVTKLYFFSNDFICSPFFIIVIC
ncbi:hypothetical protein BE25_0099 [Staphylococcus phage vB_SepM_BE25]|nr:hypothetical protein BE25_0099 [Staphylococcus phage vB_SepM_BE25]